MARNVKFSPNAVRLLHRMLKSPDQLTGQRPGGQQQAPVNPYSAPDRSARKQLIALHAMVNKHTIPVQGGAILRFEPLECRLAGDLVDRIYDLMSHYRPLLALTTNLEDVNALQLGLKGKELQADEESWIASSEEKEDDPDEDEFDDIGHEENEPEEGKVTPIRSPKKRKK